jgi:CRP/FNR family transcriptional regulator, cyclic AMP receptor protein
MSVVATLRSVPLFAELHEEDIERISQNVRTRTYPRGSVIVFEDDPGDAMFVVSKGQVKVVLTGDDGREVILATLSEGEFFGEMSLIDDEPRSAHVIAMDDSDLLVLRREDFQHRLHESPRIAIGLLGALCKRLRAADKKIGGLALLDVSGRVARLLIEMADESDGVTIRRAITHHTISQMIGSSRETVSRSISNMVEQGWIDVTRTTITIKNRSALQAAAGRG